MAIGRDSDQTVPCILLSGDVSCLQPRLCGAFLRVDFPGQTVFPCSAPRFTAGAPRNLQQPQLRQKPRQIIFDHDATLGQRKKLLTGKSELAPPPAGPSLSSPRPAAQPAGL